MAGACCGTGGAQSLASGTSIPPSLTCPAPFVSTGQLDRLKLCRLLAQAQLAYMQRYVTVWQKAARHVSRQNSVVTVMADSENYIACECAYHSFGMKLPQYQHTQIASVMVTEYKGSCPDVKARHVSQVHMCCRFGIKLPRYQQIVNALTWMSHSQTLRRVSQEYVIDLYLRPPVSRFRLMDFHLMDRIVRDANRSALLLGCFP